MLHLVHGSREIEDEGEGSLTRLSQNRSLSSEAGRYLNIGARNNQAALREWLGQALSRAQELHDSAQRLS